MIVIVIVIVIVVCCRVTAALQGRKRGQDASGGSSKAGVKQEAAELPARRTDPTPTMHRLYRYKFNGGNRYKRGRWCGAKWQPERLRGGLQHVVDEQVWRRAAAPRVKELMPVCSTPAHAFAYAGGFPNSSKTPSAFKRNRRM